jgi:hypothetical protein
LLSSLKHRTLRYEDEPVPAAKEWRSKLGVPAWEVDTWVGSYEAIAAGEFDGRSCTRDDPWKADQ